MSNEVYGSGVSVRANTGSGFVTIGCAFSCNFQFENELIGKTDVNAGLSRKKRVRISDCRGSVQGVLTTGNTATRLSNFYFLQEAIRRSEIEMQFVYEDVSGGIVVVAGLFLVRTDDISSEVNAFAEFDLQLEGTGGITITEVDPNPPVECQTIYSDWWVTSEGESGISGVGHFGRSFAGHTVIEVDREGTEHDIVDTGTPLNRQAKYTGGSTITFDPAIPFNDGEIIFVIWTEDAS